MMSAVLPPVLRGRLEFGNLEQIAAIKRLATVEDSPCKWIIEVDLSVEYEVWAASEDEAIELARCNIQESLQDNIVCTAIKAGE